MPWWAWLVLGVGLLGVEMFVIDAQFYLVFIGVSAALVGLLGLFGLALPDWLQWLLFALLSLVAMFTFRRRIYALLRSRSTGKVDERVAVGDHVPVPVRLAPGQTCRVEYRGSSWTALNDGQRVIEAGSRALISRVDGLTLLLESQDS